MTVTHMDKIGLGKEVLRRLINQGFQAYFVGGCVRDLLLNRIITDIDIATDADPKQVMSLFPHTIPTGIKHGTVTVMMEGIPIEVTTFRQESQYENYRRPKTVQFVSNLDQDLSRRDFTMNAIAMNEEERIIDPFNGQEALAKQQIVSVGDANQRFLEDPLRMMRAVRFASQLSFLIEEKTWESILKHAAYLQFIAVERIKVELDKIMESGDPETGLRLLFQSGLIRWIKGLSHIDILEANLESWIPKMKKTDAIKLRWSLFFISLSSEKRNEWMRGLRFSKREISEINGIFETYFLFYHEIDNLQLKECLVNMEETICLKAVELLFLMGKIGLEEKEIWQKQLRQLSLELPVKEIRDLAVSGRDLMDYFDQPAGPWIHAILQKLFHLVLYHQISNEKTTLLAEAKKIKEGKMDERKD